MPDKVLSFKNIPYCPVHSCYVLHKFRFQHLLYNRNKINLPAHINRIIVIIVDSNTDTERLWPKQNTKFYREFNKDDDILNVKLKIDNCK